MKLIESVFFFVYKQPWQNTEMFEYVYVYGYPRARPNYLNMLTAFPASLWCLILLWTAITAFLFIAIAKFYRHILVQHSLVHSKTNNWDIFFKVISTLTEPEEIKIFPLWSTGKSKTKQNGRICTKRDTLNGSLTVLTHK